MKKQMRWIPVDEQLPSHAYTVAVWVTKGRLVLLPNNDGYLDVGSYFPTTGEWHVNNGDSDISTVRRHGDVDRESVAAQSRAHGGFAKATRSEGCGSEGKARGVTEFPRAALPA